MMVQSVVLIWRWRGGLRRNIPFGPLGPDGPANKIRNISIGAAFYKIPH